MTRKISPREKYKTISMGIDDLIDSINFYDIPIDQMEFHSDFGAGRLYRGFDLGPDSMDFTVGQGFKLERACEILYQEKVKTEEELQQARKKLLAKYIDLIYKLSAFPRGPNLYGPGGNDEMDLDVIAANARHYKNVLEFEKRVLGVEETSYANTVFKQGCCYLDFILYLIGKMKLGISDVIYTTGIFYESELPPPGFIEVEKEMFIELAEAWENLGGLDLEPKESEKIFKRMLKEIDELFEERLKRTKNMR